MRGPSGKARTVSGWELSANFSTGGLETQRVVLSCEQERLRKLTTRSRDTAVAAQSLELDSGGPVKMAQMFGSTKEGKLLKSDSGCWINSFDAVDLFGV